MKKVFNFLRKLITFPFKFILFIITLLTLFLQYLLDIVSGNKAQIAMTEAYYKALKLAIKGIFQDKKVKVVSGISVYYDDILRFEYIRETSNDKEA